MAQLAASEKAKKDQKDTLQLVNSKVIQIEEELYESKTIQNELLDELKANEERLQEAVDRLDGMQDEIDLARKEMIKANKKAE